MNYLSNCTVCAALKMTVIHDCFPLASAQHLNCTYWCQSVIRLDTRTEIPLGLWDIHNHSFPIVLTSLQCTLRTLRFGYLRILALTDFPNVNLWMLWQPDVSDQIESVDIQYTLRWWSIFVQHEEKPNTDVSLHGGIETLENARHHICQSQQTTQSVKSEALTVTLQLQMALVSGHSMVSNLLLPLKMLS